MSTEDVSAEVVEESVSEESEAIEEVAEEGEAGEESEGSEAELSDGEAEELAEDVQDAIEAGASKEEVQELIENFKIKVNGREKEVTLDWNNKEDIIKRLQLAEAAQEAMQSKSEVEKAFQREFGRLKDNPWEVLQEIGLDPDELAEKRIEQMVQELQKSPEQKEQESKDRELQELRDKLKRQEEEREIAEQQRMEQEASQELKAEIEEAISSTTKLPKDGFIFRRVADVMSWAMDNGRPDVTAKEVVPIVEKEYNEELNRYLENMPDKALEKFLSKNVTEKLRKGRVAKIPQKKKVVDTGKSEETPVKRKKQSLLDFQKNGFKD